MEKNSSRSIRRSLIWVVSLFIIGVVIWGATRYIGLYMERRRAEQALIEQERIAAEEAERVRVEQERIAAEEAERIRADEERIATEEAEREKQEQIRVATEEAKRKSYFSQVERIKSKALQGDVESQLKLALLYNRGSEYVKRDVAESIKWYRMAAEQGAQGYLGSIYCKGEGVARDSIEGVKWYGMLAEQGDLATQRWLYRIYLAGRGVPKDYVKAFKWLRMAAESGDVEMQFRLGTCYFYGQKGVIAVDYAQAVEWFGRAAEQGSGKGQFFMGVCYENGKGVQKSEPKAKEWYDKAAKNGVTSLDQCLY